MSVLIAFTRSPNTKKALARVAEAQKSNGRWDRIEHSKGSDFLYLKNKTKNTEMVISGDSFGNKATVYIMPRNADNEIVVNMTTAAINQAICTLYGKLIPHKKMM